MSNLTVKGACLSAALLAVGAIAGASPASAQSVHIDIGVNALTGDDDDFYDRPDYPRPHRGWRGYDRSYEGDWKERYRTARYRPSYAYSGPRCTTKIIRYYDEFEDASVTKRIRRCR